MFWLVQNDDELPVNDDNNGNDGDNNGTSTTTTTPQQTTSTDGALTKYYNIFKIWIALI